MHYFWSFSDPDSEVLLSTAAELQNIMADVTSHFYAYDNLSSDPDPGGQQAHLHMISAL